MTDNHQVIFRDNLLSEFPVMKDFFNAIPCKERARALLSMSEAYARMVDPNCKDVNALYRASAAVWLGFRISGRDTINADDANYPTPVSNPTSIELSGVWQIQ